MVTAMTERAAFPVHTNNRFAISIVRLLALTEERALRLLNISVVHHDK